MQAKSVVFGFLLVPSLLLAQQKISQFGELRDLSKREARQYAQMLQAAARETPNQAQYDVRAYDISLNLLTDQGILEGRVTVRAEVTGDSIDYLELNLQQDMAVDSVFLFSEKASAAHLGDFLRVELNRWYAKGESLTVRIFYHGRPVRSGFGPFGFDEYNGEPMVWSLSEPFGARNWWPCKDVPSDKADSVNMRIEVPSGLVAVSNGLLRSVTERGGRKIYWWHESYPITTYLVSIAAYPFVHFSDTVQVVPDRKTPVDYYVFPDQEATARVRYAKTPQMIETFSRLFGPYPFWKEKYGHAQFLGGANMEHQTITSLRSYHELTIAHELAHQWWGDMITCRDFHHIWLNEGFATYSEALWLEQAYGKADYFALMQQLAYLGGGTVFVPDLTDVGRIFDYDLSYRKGAWVLHMLRHVVGDSTFFRILQAYGDNPDLKYGTAVTEDFQRVCETVSGKDLSDFFQQWIYREFHPVYVFSYQSTDSAGVFPTVVTILQEQTNTGLFHMPVDLRFIFSAGDTTVTVENFLQRQTYHFVLENQPVSLQLDPDGWILKEVRQGDTSVTEKPVPASFVLQGNFPNPFASGTEIQLRLERSLPVEAVLFDLRGKRIATLIRKRLPPGVHVVYWNGRGSSGVPVPAGLYFLRVRAGNRTAVRKLVKVGP